jgi:hypothetical protein
MDKKTSKVIRYRNMICKDCEASVRLDWEPGISLNLLKHNRPKGGCRKDYSDLYFSWYVELIGPDNDIIRLGPYDTVDQANIVRETVNLRTLI